MPVETPCPFARRAQLAAVPLEHDLRGRGQRLADFVRREDLHGTTVLSIPVSAEGEVDTVEHIASTVHTVLYTAQSSAAARHELYDGIDHPSWRLPINGVKMFALVIGELYPPHSPRHAAGSAQLLVQPEELFDSLLTPSERRRRTEVSETVSRAFRRAHRDYYYAHSRQVPKSRRILVDTDGKAVDWWKHELLL